MNEADDHLLTLIKAGDQEAWRQFVTRFGGRLLAFASREVDQLATAEDLVQESFVSFVRSLPEYRGSGELESFLFRILRRRIIDHFRSTGSHAEVPVCRIAADASHDPLAQAESTDLTASRYARQAESEQRSFESLASAIRNLAADLQSTQRFKELKVAEGVFFARQKNQWLAQTIRITPNEVAVIKRRLIARLRDQLNHQNEQDDQGFQQQDLATDLLIRVWESERPSCPKRSTLGKSKLGILPQAWDDYVEFHTQVLACTFCNANLQELERESADPEVDAARENLFQSTIGFVQKPIG